jgi:hypothetical protein
MVNFSGAGAQVQLCASQRRRPRKIRRWTIAGADHPNGGGTVRHEVMVCGLAAADGVVAIPPPVLPFRLGERVGLGAERDVFAALTVTAAIWVIR